MLAKWETDAFNRKQGKIGKTRELGNKLETNYPE